MSAPIEFEDVWRWFGSQVVLRGLSFRVEPGQVYALLGRNGAGKTTALRILLGFLAPLRGRARVLGVESEQLGPAQRAKIGYVGEDHRLYSTMRVRDVVAFEAGTRPGFRRDLVATALARCGLLEKQRVRQLSRGQRAQLCLVLAVATTPELLICDDPSLGLDVVMRRELLDALIDLLAETGCSVLLSSHFLQDVERIADRVAALASTWLSLPTIRAPRLHWREGGMFFEDGKYCVVDLDPDLGHFALRSFGKGAEQSPFAADAERVSANYPFSGPVHLIFEPSSRSLWRLEWDVGYFQPLALPNGDSLVAVLRTNSRPQFLGLEGEYEYVGDQFRWIRARERSVVIERPEAPPSTRLRAQTDADLLSPRLQIFDAAGTLVFEHAYAPRTSSERWSAALVIAWSFARPPVLSVAAHLGAAPMETENALIDPLVSGGRRTWLVALHLLFGALCAALALWRLRRLGADRGARWFWGVLTLLLGVIPLLSSLCFERRRAWSRGPAIEPSVPPRIVSVPALLST